MSELAPAPQGTLIVRFDGGARGNPGPAAAAAVVEDRAGGVLAEVAEPLGETTNNVAEYRALLLGLERARALGASAVEVRGDSELVIRQLSGAYKVRSALLRPLYERARAALEAFDAHTLKAVPRAQNARADALVNATLDGVRTQGSGRAQARPGGAAAAGAALGRASQRR
ncbi:MAG TPA: ribonuclease HI family protein [Solirubrobacteraceae bacterium]|nr:ribonuclease HI family protein [Solirubrobacteraceae bacterium]